MKKDYLVLTVAHSLHGRLRQFVFPQSFCYVILAFALFGVLSAVGVATSYARMAWKVSHYNDLRQEAQSLRERCQNLLRVVDVTNEQLETLQMFASEVSVSYGIRAGLEGEAEAFPEDALVPSFDETLQEYNFLKSASFSKFSRRFAHQWQTDVRPSIWPTQGRLISHFGARLDPFHGEGAFHAGVDIDGDKGDDVKVTADGVVGFASYFGGYGRLIVVDHGGGITTRYGHLSRIHVIPGQEVRKGEVVGEVGSTGRSTGNHLHYEVRVGGNPVNPYKFMSRAPVARAPRTDFLF